MLPSLLGHKLAAYVHSRAGAEAALETAPALQSRRGPWQDGVLHWHKASSLSLTSSIVTG